MITLPGGEQIGVVGYTLQSTPDFAKTGKRLASSILLVRKNEEIPPSFDSASSYHRRDKYFDKFIITLKIAIIPITNRLNPNRVRVTPS